MYAWRIKYQADHLYTTSVKLRLELREGAKLCGAHRSEVSRVAISRQQGSSRT